MNATEVSGASTVRRIGFRTLAIVTGNDTDPAWVAANADADGSATLHSTGTLCVPELLVRDPATAE